MDCERKTWRGNLHGEPAHSSRSGTEPGEKDPDFRVVDNDLKPVTLADFKGKIIVISAVPSLDTPVCDTETRRFSAESTNLPANVVVLTVSMDLPSAQKRRCGATGALLDDL